MKEQYLLFNEVSMENKVAEAAHDIVCYPVSRFKGFTNSGTDNTRLEMFFEGIEEGMADGDASSIDYVALVVKPNKQVEVIRDIVKAMNTSSNLVVICDQLNNEFASKHIVSCGPIPGTQD